MCHNTAIGKKHKHFAMYIVYYSTPTTLAAIEAPNSLTQTQISARVGLGCNWYRSSASSGMAAIALVVVLGFVVTANPVLGSEGYTPPDTGHPDRSQGSGTR
jgi:hypothetical protein